MHNGIVNRRDKLQADNVNKPVLNTAFVTDNVSDHIVEIIDDHKEEIKPIIGGGSIEISTEERLIGKIGDYNMYAKLVIDTYFIPTYSGTSFSFDVGNLLPNDTIILGVPALVQEQTSTTTIDLKHILFGEQLSVPNRIVTLAWESKTLTVKFNRSNADAYSGYLAAWVFYIKTEE